MYDIKRCRMSQEGRNNFKRSIRKNSEGWVVGETRDGKCFKVMWEGSKRSHIYLKEFIEFSKQVN